MASNWISEEERQYRVMRKAEQEKLSRDVERRNEMFVGEVKSYKGIRYQMRQRGSYTCLGLPPLSGLEGDFTSTAVLHSIINNLENLGRLPK